MSEKPVVVGVDGSPCSRVALEYALDEAARRGAPLVAVSAVVLPEFWANSYGAFVPPPSDEEILDAVGKETREFVDDVVAAHGAVDAARVDGAGGLYVLRRVTLPLLAPVLVVAILLRSLDAMKVFEYVFATTRGGPGTETETLQYFIYQTGIQFFRLGSASSMAFVVLVLVLAVIVLAFRRMDKARADGTR